MIGAPEVRCVSLAALAMIAAATLTTVSAAASAVASAETTPAGSTPQADRENFLRSATIVSRRDVGVGITLPVRVELEKDGVSRSAMFKSADLSFPANIRVGREIQEGLRDSWKYEVAAYELDKLLDLGMVPVTVAREIDDREGALIDWIDDVLPEYGALTDEFDLAAWDDEVAAAWLFDYIAYNIDRTPENLLITQGFDLKLIDHSRAFQRFLVPMRPLSRFPRRVVERLRVLSDEEIRAALEAYLTVDEIDALLERRRRVLLRVDELLAENPENDVLF